MTAVFRHELRMMFSSLTAYVYGMFSLLAVAIYMMYYNLSVGYANFEYALAGASFALLIMIPIITMRIIAEEKKQKTDQLLYSLPITTLQVVLGKYLALLAVYAVPLCVIATYPLIFSRYGEVYLPTSYGSLFAFFLLGAALLAVGMFLSSLTDNQGFAAGIGIAAILLNYYSVSLSEYVSSTAFGSAVALYVLIILLGALIQYVTRNEKLAWGVGVVLLVLAMAAYWLEPAAFEGLLPRIMTQLSLFERFYVFVNGVFDWTAVVYYASVIGFFLFLTVQSLEKRRYN